MLIFVNKNLAVVSFWMFLFYRFIVRFVLLPSLSLCTFNIIQQINLNDPKINCKTKFSSQHVFIYKIWAYRKLVLTLNYCWNFNRRKKCELYLYKCMLCTKCIILKIYHDFGCWNTQNKQYFIPIYYLVFSVFVFCYTSNLCVCTGNWDWVSNSLFTCWEHG